MTYMLSPQRGGLVERCHAAAENTQAAHQSYIHPMFVTITLKKTTTTTTKKTLLVFVEK